MLGIIAGLAVKSSRERTQLAKMLVDLQTMQKTVEVMDGVFEKMSLDLSQRPTTIHDISAGQSEQIKALDKRLQDLDARAAALMEVVVSQRQKRVTGTAHATQAVEKPSAPGNPERRRVDFDLELSRFRVSGHTLTDPAESILTLEEVRPLKLGIAVSRGKDGKWRTDVSTEDGSKADVRLSVVDEKAISGGWRDRLSVVLAAGAFPNQTASVGLLYGNKIAVGPFCQVSPDSSSCGVTMTWRPFSR